MAGRQPTLVNRQFNSPIKLYSQQNVNEALNKQAQVLANGAVGIDFHQLAVPANLANSAVLRMLEEEERGRGEKGFKRVEWPPPPEENDLPVTESEPVYAKGPVLGSTAAPQPAVRQQQYQPQQQYQSQQQYQPQHQYQPLQQQQQPAYQTHIAPVSKVYQPAPPPATITLRPSPPVHEEPHPVFESQPAAIRAVGPRMRGDQKWPPSEYKVRSEEENAARRALAKGPAFRPRKVQKDYTPFFAKNALTATYPGYRAPPGTQHYTEEGTSDL